MTITVVTRWSTPDVEATTRIARLNKSIYLRHGAKDFRVNQIFTGANTGQFVVAIVFSDWAAYAKVRAEIDADSEYRENMASSAKVGAVLHEREILVGLEL